MVRDRIRRSLIDSGYPTAKVDEVFKEVEKIPDELVESYVELLKENVKERLDIDEDYKDAKNNSKYEYLH